MPKYKIFAGLGGGFGGQTEVGTFEFATEYDAEIFAEEQARDEYRQYAGSQGLRSIEEIMEEDEVEESEAEEIMMSEMDSWIDFEVEEIKSTYAVTFAVLDTVWVEAANEEEAEEEFKKQNEDYYEIMNIEKQEEEEDD